ncbi:hypothetical protein GCM10022243_33380 [Saccharothrix violaceirubra]|uniref:Uncharacterized protein n=1 Tax=Saccharothrix violaceirubra TaxID=413306 RepID=A0A7W7WV56_9PSEU|nr:hypothetical protein [Saccharothrix violaceirubra]MBB4964188.1 hypothetical protein [Saccharothrix violaceirubra]
MSVVVSSAHPDDLRSAVDVGVGRVAFTVAVAVTVLVPGLSRVPPCVQVFVAVRDLVWRGARLRCRGHVSAALVGIGVGAFAAHRAEVRPARA